MGYNIEACIILPACLARLALATIHHVRRWGGNKSHRHWMILPMRMHPNLCFNPAFTTQAMPQPRPITIDDCHEVGRRQVHTCHDQRGNANQDTSCVRISGRAVRRNLERLYIFVVCFPPTARPGVAARRSLSWHISMLDGP